MGMTGPFSRRIIVSDLPRDIRLWSILQHVRGGPLVSARLYDTTAVGTGMSAVLEFAFAEHAAAFFRRLEARPLILTSHRTGLVLRPVVTRPPTASYPLAVSVIRGMSHGVTRVVVAKRFPPCAVWLLLVEAKLYTAERIRELGRVEYGLGGELTIELPTVREAQRVLSLIISGRGWLRNALAGSDVTARHGPDPCAGSLDAPRFADPTGSLDVPQPVADPVEFFCRAVFQTKTVIEPARLPKFNQAVRKMVCITRPLHVEDFTVYSPGYCPERIAAAEDGVERSIYRDHKSGVCYLRIPWGREYLADDYWEMVVHQHLESEDPAWHSLIDEYFTTTGDVNLRKLAAYSSFKKRIIPSSANLWGILIANS